MNDNDLKILVSSAPQPHVPEKLPLDTFNLIDKEVFSLLTKAHNAMGKYNGFLLNTPNPYLLLSPITTQEAVLSSKLEGTHATLEDILNHEAGNQVNIESDEIKEILNYRHALSYALDNITPADLLDQADSKSPLTLKIIKEMHKILLDNVRGSSKHPGNFKITQNYIGGFIGGSANISFTPLPAHLTDEYMSNLEKYINSEDWDALIQASIIHAQFEMIHPFEDGNGRIGRLLIPLFFFYTGIIPFPMFYMSSYFEKDRSLYIQKLSNISQKNEWKEWIIYFLNGVIIQSKTNTLKAAKILDLYNSYKIHADKIKNYCYIEILDYVFQHPIFTAKQLHAHINERTTISQQTIYNILNKMIDLKIISATSKQRNKSFLCIDLLSIVDA